MQDRKMTDKSAAGKNVEHAVLMFNKKLSNCWETVRRESIPRIAEMDVEMAN